MASIIRTDSISTVSGTGNISLPTGNKIISPDVGGLVAPGHVVQVQYKSSGIRTTINSTSFVEPSTDYRVSITPKFNNSLIVINYYVPTNPGANYVTNTIFSYRAFKSIAGSKSYSLTSAGNANGSRNVFSGITTRPQGFDSNDPVHAQWQSIDVPGTTSTIDYGFEAMRESGGTGTMYFGYSAGDSSAWGFDIDIVITAWEIAQ